MWVWEVGVGGGGGRVPLCCVSLGACHWRRVRLCLFLGTGDCASSPPLRCCSAIYPSRAQSPREEAGVSWRYLKRCDAGDTDCGGCVTCLCVRTACVTLLKRCVVSVWVYVTGADCDLPFPKGDDAHRVPAPLSRGVDRQASRGTALHLRLSLLYIQTPVVPSGHGPPSHLVSEVPSGGRCGQSRTLHLCAMPTILSHLCVNE